MPTGRGRPRSGKVTAISGDTLTVAVSEPGSKETTDVTVTTTDKTTVTVTEASKASAAKAGVCATVNGKADDTGAVDETVPATSPESEPHPASTSAPPTAATVTLTRRPRSHRPRAWDGPARPTR